MRLPALSRDQVRAIDKIAIEQFFLPGIVLMENAGRGAAEIIHSIAPQGPVVILCGSGNNGGDGYVIARHLDLWERTVRIVSLADPSLLLGDARINADVAEKSAIPIHVATDRREIAKWVGDAATIVDCLLGTGARGDLREPYADAVVVANEAPARLRIAIDIPTGLDCDTGTRSVPTFQADHTITFVSRKVGFAKQNASEVTGVIHEVGIGVPLQLLKQLPSFD